MFWIWFQCLYSGLSYGCVDVCCISAFVEIPTDPFFPPPLLLARFPSSSPLRPTIPSLSSLYFLLGTDSSLVGGWMRTFPKLTVSDLWMQSPGALDRGVSLLWLVGGMDLSGYGLWRYDLKWGFLGLWLWGLESGCFAGVWGFWKRDLFYWWVYLRWLLARMGPFHLCVFHSGMCFYCLSCYISDWMFIAVIGIWVCFVKIRILGDGFCGWLLSVCFRFECLYLLLISYVQIWMFLCGNWFGPSPNSSFTGIWVQFGFWWFRFWLVSFGFFQSLLICPFLSPWLGLIVLARFICFHAAWLSPVFWGWFWTVLRQVCRWFVLRFSLWGSVLQVGPMWAVDCCF